MLRTFIVTLIFAAALPAFANNPRATGLDERIADLGSATPPSLVPDAHFHGVEIAPDIDLFLVNHVDMATKDERALLDELSGKVKAQKIRGLNAETLQKGIENIHVAYYLGRNLGTAANIKEAMVRAGLLKAGAGSLAEWDALEIFARYLRAENPKLFEKVLSEARKTQPSPLDLRKVQNRVLDEPAEIF